MHCHSSPECLQVGSLAPSQAPLQGPPPAADAAMYGRDASGSVPHPTTHVSVLRVLAADPQRVLAYLALTTGGAAGPVQPAEIRQPPLSVEFCGVPA